MQWWRWPGRLIVVSALFVASALALAVPARAETLVFHGSSSGQLTLDQGEGGGNPFASALIEILTKPAVRLAELPTALREITSTKSRGLQLADVPKEVASQSWSLVPATSGERRVALVLVVSDYSQLGPDESLPGAKHDAHRIAAALTAAGFATEIALDLALSSMRRKLADFAARSALYDAAVIYTTGHGAEVGGTVFLLPTDYPVEQETSGLAKHAMRLSEIASASRARSVNLVFYGGCRDNPWP